MGAKFCSEAIFVPTFLAANSLNCSHLKVTPSFT